MEGVLLTLIIIRRSAYSSSRLDFQVAEENLLLSMMFMLAVRRTVEELLGDMVVGGQGLVVRPSRLTRAPV